MNNENECPICFNSIQFPKKLDCCKKQFHEDCLNKWYTKSSTCPCCRSIDPKNIKKGEKKVVNVGSVDRPIMVTIGTSAQNIVW